MLQLPDGTTRLCCPIVVNHCVDHAQAVKDTISKNNACTGCSATGSSGDFNLFNHMFERKWTDKMKNLYYELLRDDRFKGLFNEKGFMLSQTLLDKVQKLFLGCRFLPNAWWDAFLYDVYCQTLPEPLHLADLGLFPAILEAIRKDFDNRVLSFLPEKEREKAVEAIEARMNSRLQGCLLLGGKTVGGEAALNIWAKLRTAFIQKQSSPVLKAWQFRRLMLVAPIAFANLLAPEIAEASKYSGTPLKSCYDPCISACTVLVLWVEWYALARYVFVPQGTCLWHHVWHFIHCMLGPH